MSKKSKTAKAPKQTPAQIKAAADARIAKQATEALEVSQDAKAVEAACKAEALASGRTIPQDISPAEHVAKPAKKVAPLTLKQRAELGDKAAQAEIEAAAEKKFDELTGSAKTLAKLNGKAPKAAKAKKAGSPRMDLLGHSVTSVLRWMGKSGWSATEARYACSKLGVEPAPATIQIQLRDGKTGSAIYGVPAELSAEDAKKLDGLRKATPAS